MTEPSRAEKQVAGRRETRLTKTAKAKLVRFAKDNHLSRSEAIRFVLTRIAEDKHVRPAERKTERLIYWDPDSVTDKVTKVAAAAGTPATDLIDSYIKENL